MKSVPKHSIIRWLTPNLGVPTISYIYSPVAKISTTTMFTGFAAIPPASITEAWLWLDAK